MEEVIRKLGEVRDPESGLALLEANLLVEVSLLDDGTLQIIYSPRSPCSPVAVNLGLDIKRAALEVGLVEKVRVECVGHLMDDVVNRLLNSDYKG